MSWLLEVVGMEYCSLQKKTSDLFVTDRNLLRVQPGPGSTRMLHRGGFGGLPVGGALCREILSYGGTMLCTAVNCWAKGVDPILEAVKIWPCYDVVLGRSEEDVPVGRVDL